MKFLAEPSKYAQSNSVPLDVQYSSKTCVLGLQRSGKSTLCKRISQMTGAIHLQLDEIIQKYIDADSVMCEKLRTHMKKEGRQIDDQTLIQLLVKRCQAKDCLKNGWVIENFP